MEAKIIGLQLFRNSLYNTAARSLREKHPKYVEALLQMLAETGDLSKALDSVKTMPTDVGFAKWRPLLTATFDTELAINQIRTVLNLLEIIPPRKVVPPQDILISEGAWVYYHVNVWIFWMDALLERVKKLVKQTVRSLVRPTNPKWKDVESDLLQSISLLSQDIGKMRDPLAHGGGVAEVPAQERLWEGLVLISTLANRSISFDDVFGSMTKYHASWHKRLYEKSVLALATIEKEMDELNKHLDWDKILTPSER